MLAGKRVLRHMMQLVYQPTACSTIPQHLQPQVSKLGYSTATAPAVVEQKRSLRSRVRKELQRQYPSLSSSEDELIQNHVLKAPWYKNSSLICSYISCPAIREVNTSKIISDIFQSAESSCPKMLYVPWVEDKQGCMKFFHITSSDELVRNSMGIAEPRPIDKDGIPRQDVIQANKPIDLVLMPGLAFDQAGRRLGRGGGYYDVFLNRYLCHAKDKGWQPPLLVGLAYSVQILDEVIPTDHNDVPMDALISGSGILRVTNDTRLNM